MQRISLYKEWSDHKFQALYQLGRGHCSCIPGICIKIVKGLLLQSQPVQFQVVWN